MKRTEKEKDSELSDEEIMKELNEMLKNPAKYGNRFYKQLALAILLIVIIVVLAIYR
ncbi:MAG: hypothetical protein ABJG68_01915 [Crocinitomicaceae bacterium]